MAEIIHIVKVLRNGSFVDMESCELVPGDIIVPSGEIICDCILVRDEVYVNEASLTGENIPIGKSSALNFKNTKEPIYWLY
jgi:P-type E1-E2 ATPase